MWTFLSVRVKTIHLKTQTIFWQGCYTESVLLIQKHEETHTKPLEDDLYEKACPQVRQNSTVHLRTFFTLSNGKKKGGCGRAGKNVNRPNRQPTQTQIIDDILEGKASIDLTPTMSVCSLLIRKWWTVGNINEDQMMPPTPLSLRLHAIV